MMSNAHRDDHRKITDAINELLVSLRKGDCPRQEINSLRDELERHIYIDETYLFKLAENSQNKNRIRGLEIEHAGMLQLIDKICGYLENNDRTRAMDRAEGLARVLEAHNITEDQNVYAALDAMSVDIDSVIQNIENSLVPPGWKCKFLQR